MLTKDNIKALLVKSGAACGKAKTKKGGVLFPLKF